MILLHKLLAKRTCRQPQTPYLNQTGLLSKRYAHRFKSLIVFKTILRQFVTSKLNNKEKI